MDELRRVGSARAGRAVVIMVVGKLSWECRSRHLVDR